MSSYITSHKKEFNLKKFVENALQEDIGDGDHTSLSTIPKSSKGKMHLLVKQNGILAGVEAAKEIIKLIDAKLKLTIKIKDGAKVKKGDVAFILEGNTQKMLVAERLILNVMQRMSGIATHTAELMAICKGTKTKVIDTRKTTPGFRFFEKWAVVIGGGANHRYGLFDMILIKDNHIDFAGGITKAIDAANEYLKKNKKKLRIEVETRSLDDVVAVLEHGGFHRIMLDNFPPQNCTLAVKLINGAYEVEASGGINESNLKAYAKTGVDYISIGALTHQVKSLDLSLKAIK